MLNGSKRRTRREREKKEQGVKHIMRTTQASYSRRKKGVQDSIQDDAIDTCEWGRENTTDVVGEYGGYGHVE